MSASTYYPDSYHLKLCPFPPSFNTTSHYICFKYERCCPQGCCYSFSYTYFQSWYFWLAVAAFFVIFYAASWYCKKVEKRRRRFRARNVVRDSLQSHPSSRHGETNVDLLLNTLVHTYRAQTVNETRANRKYTDLPPNYGDAVNMPKFERGSVQVAQIHVSDGGSAPEDRPTDEGPPTYEDATKSRQREGV